MSDNLLLQVKHLRTWFETFKGTVRAVDDISFDIRRGEVLAVVGESGGGKSVTGFSIIRLIDEPGHIVSGEIVFDGRDIMKLPEHEMNRLRGRDISMVFQDPMTSLNPVYTIGQQIDEMLALHTPLSRAERHAESIRLLKAVGISNAEARLKNYPHQFSGGMKQRVVIAMALACNPELLIADEPTTALDVTIQAQIMDLLKSLSKQLHTAIILITHDLGVVADICDRVAVMYAGEIVETGNRRDIFYHHEHPYTKGLLDSVPGIDDDTNRPLIPIRGNPPEMSRIGSECAFARRCPYAMNICARQNPEELSVGEGHSVRCWLTVRRLMEEQKQENAKR